MVALAVSGTGQVVRRAHAKLNLALSVGPPDSGGMHPIASWMAAIDLADDVKLEKAGDAAASRYEIRWAPDAPRASAVDWPLDRDLGVRAHRLLEREAGRVLPIRMALHKRIPVGGGLGGGSSDAAAVLMGVNDLFGLGLSVGRLAELSRELGSDVAFFLDEAAGDGPPRPAIVTGLGDRVERMERIAGEVVLILPPFGCPTGPVYRAYDEMGARALREGEVRSLAAEAGKEGRAPWGALFNDLAAPAAEAVPSFGRLLRELRARADAVPVHVSGSGSTLFAPAGDVAWARGNGVEVRRVRLT